LGYFSLICGIYTLKFWLPTIFKNAGIDNALHVGFYTMIPYAVTGLGMIVMAWSSDYFQERVRHCAVLSFVGAVALFVMTLFSTTQFAVMLISVCIAMVGIYSSYTIFWTLPTQYFQGESNAGVIALINSLGLLGGFVSPFLIGVMHSATGSLEAGLYLMSGLLLVGTFGIVRGTR
jgi:MFS family permease